MTAPARLGAAAVQLRISGASFDDIARTLGLSSARAALTTVTRALADQTEEDSDERRRLRTETNMQLEACIASVMGKATDRNDPEHLPAVRTLVSVLDRRAKLNGLDAPTEVTVHNPTMTEIDNWVSMAVRQSMPTVVEADTDEMLGIIDAEVIEPEPADAGT